ncbi:MAG: protein translocase subunit SecF [Candidatus Margulisiibacteriota bacterium]
MKNTEDKKQKVYKIVEKSGLWYAMSGIIVVAGILAIIFSGLNVGIDFTGGTNLMIKSDKTVSTGQIRDELKAMGIEKSVIQRTGKESENICLIRMPELENAKRVQLIENMNRNLGGIEVLEVDHIGPSIGEELKQQSLWIILTVLGLLLVYITFRFEFWSGCATIIALIHDTLVTLGFIALFGYEIDIAVIVAILTIMGYSINDTIVVFDRIRENSAIHKKRLPFVDIANLSITQTLSRSINTSFTVLLAIMALIIFGGATIKVFAVVLFVGIATGTYSSIFIAAPTLAAFKKIKI